MPQSKTIPMIDPRTGSIGDIPVEGVAQAVRDGLKVGKEVTTADGQKGVIPFDQFGAFMQEHGPQPTSERVPDALDIFKGAIDRMGTVTPEDRIGHGALVNALQTFGAGGYKGIIGPIVHPYDTIKSMVQGAAIPTGQQLDAMRQQNANTPMSQIIPDALGQAAGASILGMGAENLGDLIPQKARAIANFQNLKSQLANQPINLKASIDPLLEMQAEADAGATMPQAASKLLNRATDPSAAPINYPEARRFVSNVSRLSSAEGANMTPTMGRLAGILRDSLHSDIAQAAVQSGLKAEDYMGPVNEYRRASTVGTALKKAAKIGATGAGAYIAGKGAVNAYKDFTR